MASAGSSDGGPGPAGPHARRVGVAAFVIEELYFPSVSPTAATRG